MTASPRACSALRATTGTSSMISNFSDAEYLIKRPPHPREGEFSIKARPRMQTLNLLLHPRHTRT